MFWKEMGLCGGVKMATTSLSLPPLRRGVSSSIPLNLWWATGYMTNRTQWKWLFASSGTSLSEGWKLLCSLSWNFYFFDSLMFLACDNVNISSFLLKIQTTINKHLRYQCGQIAEFGYIVLLIKKQDNHISSSHIIV